MKKLEQNAYKEVAKLVYVGGARGPVDCEAAYADGEGKSPIKKKNSVIAYLGLLAHSIVLLIPSSWILILLIGKILNPMIGGD